MSKCLGPKVLSSKSAAGGRTPADISGEGNLSRRFKFNKIRKELVIMMLYPGSRLSFLTHIPTSLNKCLGSGLSLPTSPGHWPGPALFADVFCLQFTQNIFTGVEFWKVYVEYMCGNNPPGDNSFDDCRFLTFLFLRARG